jgi:transposase
MAPTHKQPHDWREVRRLRAWELHQQGWTQEQIAQALGVTQGAVSQWITRARQGGSAALQARPLPGATPRLNPQQVQQLPTYLAQGAQAWGFAGEVWTRARIAQVIQRQFGVSYHESHVGRLLKKLGAKGWSRQKPARRARQRDEVALAKWQQERWPELKKKHRKKAAP